MADIWSEKNVGFIGPVKFLSDLTVGPTYFAKSDPMTLKGFNSTHRMSYLIGQAINDTVSSVTNGSAGIWRYAWGRICLGWTPVNPGTQ